MPTFAYQARDKSGERISGTSEAPDKRAALEALREQGFFVTQLAPAATEGRGAKEKRSREAAPAPRTTESASSPAPAQAAPSTVGNVTGAAHGSTAPPIEKNLWLTASAKERSLFFRSMHSMINAGTSLGAALDLMAKHGTNKSLRRAAAEMSKATTQGQPWSETMRAYPSLFDELSIGMITAGEAGGFLDRMCLRLADYAERDYDLQQTIKRETWYSKLLVFAAILIPSSVPAFLASQVGGSVFGAWVQSVAPPFTIIGVGWLLWKFSKRVAPLALLFKPLTYALDWLKLVIPGVSKTSRALAAAKLCRAMGALYASGMGVNKIIDISAGACGNAYIAESARRTIPRVERGESLSDAMEATQQLPPIALQMLRTGEMTGAIDTQLDKVADFMEQDAETAVKQAVKLFSILLYLMVAVYVGMTVIQSYSNMYLDPVNKLIDEGGG